VQTSAAVASAITLPTPVATALEPELRDDPMIWRPRSSTALLHEEAERRGVAQTTLLRFCTPANPARKPSSAPCAVLGGSD